MGLSNDIDYKIKTAMAIINEKLDPNNTESVTGTLDVSTCNTNKMSHYIPDPTEATSATEASAAATVPATSAASSGVAAGNGSQNGGTTGYNYNGTYSGNNSGTNNNISYQ